MLAASPTSDHFTLNNQSIVDCQPALIWIHQEHFEKPVEEPKFARDAYGQVDIAVLHKALNYLPSDDYGTWITVGFALKSAGLSFELWDEWSQNSNNYVPGECSEKWKTFKRNEVGLGTVFYLAKQNGFRFSDERNETADIAMWPTLPDAALYGLAGEITKLATKDSEADPAAVLITTLVMAGASFGAQCFISVGETRHSPRLMAAIVGASSRARKGTSTNPVLRILSAAEDYLDSFFEFGELRSALPHLQISHGPLSSGEGLVYAIRDASEKVDKKGDLEDPGIKDKRLLVIEGELGAPLKAMQREGNTLSAIVRTAWDSGNIAPLTKLNRIKVTGAHICIVGHITRNELSGLLQSADVWNGFANRFVWVCARRQKEVPFPQPLPDESVKQLAARLAQAIATAHDRTVIKLDADAETAWAAIYSQLSCDAPGIFGAVTARAEAQVMRFAIVYALLDKEGVIGILHLRAALALWEYCRDSAQLIFGNVETDPNTNRVLAALGEGEKTQTQLNDLFSGHLSATQLRTILSELQAVGRITQHKKGGGKGKGRATTIWSLSTGFSPVAAEKEEIEE
jgi:hypothetical protein